MTDGEIENALCGVVKPKGQLRKRGLHAWDLLNGNKLKTNNKGGRGCQPHVTDFPFVKGLVLRLHGDGAKAVGKKLNKPWQPFQSIVRDLGLEPVSAGGWQEDQDDKLEKLSIKLMESKRKADIRAESRFDQMRHWGSQDTKELCAWKTKRRYHNDLEYRIYKNIQGHLASTLKCGKFVSKRLKQALGCTIPELKQHLENNFLDGMTWENQGAGENKWQIDHLKPRSWFDQTNPKDFAECWHYSNLQPAWRHHNYRKGNRFGEERLTNGFQTTINV